MHRGRPLELLWVHEWDLGFVYAGSTKSSVLGFAAAHCSPITGRPALALDFDLADYCGVLDSEMSC